MKFILNLKQFALLLALLSFAASEVCFRRYVTRRGGFCKGPIRRTSASASTCCAQGRVAGFAAEKVRKFRPRNGRQRNAYVCSPCSDLNKQTSTTAAPRVIWSQWSKWGRCSKTCKAGYQERRRVCETGNECKGNAVQIKPCMERQYCPIDGRWGPWYPWQQCSKPCAGGEQKRIRTCTNPKPQYGGEQCEGASREKRTCNLHPCPIDGNWGRWSGYSSCSKTCGRGKETRKRKCDNPRPQFGGKSCPGSSTDRRRCMLRKCPVNGGWSLWSDYTPCVVSCGEGTQTRTRSCNSPRPKYGGHDCAGEGIEIKKCAHRRPCPGKK